MPGDSSRYLHLSGFYYFDTNTRDIVKQQGGKYVFLKHDQRQSEMPVMRERRKVAYTPPVQLQPIGKDLYWDQDNKCVYRRTGNNFVLYSRDRRKRQALMQKSADKRGK